MKVTNKEVKISVFGEEVIIPKGTPTTHKTACGIDTNYNFVNDFSWYKPELTGFARKMALHDFVHYGINIPKEFVAEIL